VTIKADKSSTAFTVTVGGKLIGKVELLPRSQDDWLMETHLFLGTFSRKLRGYDFDEAKDELLTELMDALYRAIKGIEELR